jgi:hypothetical protein
MLDMTKKMVDYIEDYKRNVSIIKELREYIGIGEYHESSKYDFMYQYLQIKEYDKVFTLYFNYDKRQIFFYTGKEIESPKTMVNDMTVGEVVQMVSDWLECVKDNILKLKEQKLKEMF